MQTLGADGYDVTVVTNAPNHPAGVLYRGFRNRLVQRSMVDGIRVVRSMELPRG